MNKTEIRNSTAYHEASHAVVAARYGWWIIEPGIRIDSTAHVQFRSNPWDWVAPLRITMFLAGELAALLHLGRQPTGPYSQEEFDALYDDIKEGWGELDGDQIEVIRILFDRYPTMPQPRLYLLFQRLERLTLRLVQQPEIWTCIDGLAKALIERGDLSAEDATEVMAGLGCWDYFHSDTDAINRRLRRWGTSGA
jgi:hypothetical protein